MIDALIGGRIHGTASQRTRQSGKPFVTCKVRVPLADGDALFVSVITFAETVGATLLALEDGDSISLSGAITPKVWTDRDGQAHPALDMVAHAALTAYHVNRKRQATVRAMEGAS